MSLSEKNTADTHTAPSSELTSSELNWYDRLHPFGNTQTNSVHRPLNLSLFFRIWLAVAIIIVVAGIVVFTQLFNHVRPISQQVIEDTLVDTAKLLAVSLQVPMQTGQLANADFQAQLDTAFLPDFSKNKLPYARYADRQQMNTLTTWYQTKTHSSFRVYVTDAKGVVIYDSLTGAMNAEGADYSRWNDVHLTLNGHYGARTTRRVIEDENTSVMYVAQPIYDDANNLLGVVSVGKPTATILPYLTATRQRMLFTSLGISVVALVLAGLVAWWLQQSMRLVTRYTQALAQDTKKPYFYLGKELNELTDTIEAMKHRLENRAYVTDYVHTLTHELKSPLTAIRASGELLENTDLEADDRVMLSHTITEQSVKLQQLIDRLLLLAKIEQPTFRLALAQVDLHTLLSKLMDDYRTRCVNQNIELIWQPSIEADSDQHAPFVIHADAFWLTQAVQNVLDNAVYFAQSVIVVTLRQDTDARFRNNDINNELSSLNRDDKNKHVRIEIFNDGEPIPDYALNKVFERYFSLSHQTQKRNAHKGTGLGLPLVQQVVHRHGGSVNINNVQTYYNHGTGVLVQMRF